MVVEARRGNELTGGEPKESEARETTDRDTLQSRQRKKRQKPGECMVTEANGRECVRKKERVKGTKCCKEV